LAEEVAQVLLEGELEIGEVWLATRHDPTALAAVDPDDRH
jgi:hypothetical protein